MFGNRFSSSITCSRWRHETKPGRLDQSRSCRFLKVATHPFKPGFRRGWYPIRIRMSDNDWVVQVRNGYVAGKARLTRR